MTTTDPTATAPQPAPPDLDAVQARSKLATDHLDALAKGQAQWTMRVPADPDRDSDLVLDASLSDVDRLVAEVRQLRETAAVNHGLYKSAEEDVTQQRERADRLRAERDAIMSLTRNTDGGYLHADAEIPVSEVWRVVTELDAAPAAPCCTQRAGYDCDEHPGPLSTVPPAGTPEGCGQDG